ncbi:MULTISPECIES: hypothetical protein [unclassified Mesorhizobium]|uniref:hypothetical protein n=1 Tax=unclassified Mesorhizobium TaxID=325217 RepID=UPI00112AB73E|nr:MULTISPECIES: hypothetical protein [unclassified Mesorhizobium]MBZ9799057.1 hypothetical protein [Mesorhizobium sp. ES1-4]TPJ38248.1 hypothetical protein FJ432_23020 [Mesorhizobium sp. B2-6-5]TPK54810.1 hypothetical protein FJ546_29690 [Mesorhizobium sp. B2-4-19]
MSTLQREFNVGRDLRIVAPIQHYSKIIEFAKEVAREEAHQMPTSVEIFSDSGRWYCQVRRGNEKTRPMGPYTKLQAERIQEARRALIAKRGTARIMFE